jgi:hypothetical protein
MEELEEKNEKVLVLLDFLNLELSDYDEIFEDNEFEFTYNGNIYNILTEKELKDRIDEMINDKIDEVQWNLDTDCLIENCNSEFITISINEEAICNYFENEFGYEISPYNNNYQEFNNYYIFY